MIATTPAPESNPYGPAVPPSEAPSAITQAVASLPPEQMFELMKQMKVCIQGFVGKLLFVFQLTYHYLFSALYSK